MRNYVLVWAHKPARLLEICFCIIGVTINDGLATLSLLLLLLLPEIMENFCESNV